MHGLLKRKRNNQLKLFKSAAFRVFTKLGGQTAEQQARTSQPAPCLGNLRQPIVMHDRQRDR